MDTKALIEAVKTDALRLLYHSRQIETNERRKQNPNDYINSLPDVCSWELGEMHNADPRIRGRNSLERY